MALAVGSRAAQAAKAAAVEQVAAFVAAVDVVLVAAVPALEVPSIARCCSTQRGQISAI